MEGRAGEAAAEEQAKQEERVRKEKEAKEAVEAELARRAPSVTKCLICDQSYSELAAAATSAGAAGDAGLTTPASSSLTALLPCCHTVCRACVRKSVEASGATCPFCFTRFDSVIKTMEDVDALLSNPFLEERLQVQEPCSECAKEDMVGTAIARCSRCPQVLCDAHAQLHARKPATSDHPLQRIAQANANASDVCNAHSKPLDMYCVNCQVVVCAACILKNGQHPAKDPAHDTILLSEHLGTLKAKLAAAKGDAVRRQAEGVAQLASIRITEEKAHERAARLSTDVNRAIALMIASLEARQATLLEEVANLARTEQEALVAAAGAEEQHWASLQGAVALTDELLATGTSSGRVGQMARTVSNQLVTAARKGLNPAPSLEEITLFVDPSVKSVLETVGKLQYHRGFGPNCSIDVAGAGLAKIGRVSKVTVTTISRSNERVRVGGDRVEARLISGNDSGPGVTCQVNDGRDGTYTVVFKAVALGVHRLHITVNGAAIIGSPLTLHVVPVRFDWGGSPEYDKRGILYHLATSNGTRPWTNPHDAGIVQVTAQGEVSGSLSGFVSNAVGTLRVGPAAGAWLALELKGQRVLPNGYMLSYYAGGRNGANAPRNWRFEGSSDGTVWTVLKTHVNDTTFTGSVLTAYWSVTTASDAKAFSHFRVALTGKDSTGNDWLYTSCIELYGELV